MWLWVCNWGHYTLFVINFKRWQSLRKDKNIFDCSWISLFLDRQNFEQCCCEYLLWICSVCRCSMHTNWELFSSMSVELQIGDNSTFVVRVYSKAVKVAEGYSFLKAWCFLKLCINQVLLCYKATVAIKPPWLYSHCGAIMFILLHFTTRPGKMSSEPNFNSFYSDW